MLEWKDSLVVGIDDIDKQHKELFNRINNLIIAIGSGNIKENINVVFAFLEYYVNDHFALEKSIWTCIPTPEQKHT